MVWWGRGGGMGEEVGVVEVIDEGFVVGGGKVGEGDKGKLKVVNREGGRVRREFKEGLVGGNKWGGVGLS